MAGLIPAAGCSLDIDATLTRVHAEKEDAKGNYKRGFGSHPVACFADCSGEALAVEHRPGNAGANTIADLVGIIDAGLDALPESVAQSHRPGAVAAEAGNDILVRSDSAGHTLGLESVDLSLELAWLELVEGRPDFAEGAGSSVIREEPANGFRNPLQQRVQDRSGSPCH